ncbi:palmitoyltransferase PFA4 [Coprinopsis marcescibilis]|uniref:Palmitoyltransferase PFA4 n=1 Tax=Coprinopsis marcescibilis TaxID=230819 RepID=A0A5C3L1G3_COPMA|nr:palmitoyltransferase PFA4 [Coprinopsis marcescibilis]
MHYILGRIAVGGVLCLISFIAYSAQLFVIWPWYGREWSIELLVLLIPFNISVGILFYNYFLCITTAPGTVPQGWKPDTHNDGYEVKKLTGTPRYCRVCQCYKPPRTHHCRDCDRCVLRMDHHCPWINNCVGYFNYAHFVRFLFWVDVSCSYHLAMISKRTLEAMRGAFWNEPSSTELIFLILNFVTCVPVLLVVGGFSIYHFFNLLGNSTTIEGWEKDKVATMVRRGQIQEVKFPYDLGKLRNIKAVLGPSFLFWCIPQPMTGNGLRFELAAHADEHQIWPPREPDSLPRKVIDPTASPFTYGEERLNPSLSPSNIRRRQTGKHSNGGSSPAHALPPYHPDYKEGEYFSGTQNQDLDDYSESESEISEPPSGKPGSRVRRGSEGYEIQPQTREEILRRYLEEIGDDPYRYARYEPEPVSESEGSEDDRPLGRLKSDHQSNIV